MEKAKEIAQHIIMMYRANKLAGKETDTDEVAKLIYQYGQEVGRIKERLQVLYKKQTLLQESYKEQARLVDKWTQPQNSLRELNSLKELILLNSHVIKELETLLENQNS